MKFARRKFLLLNSTLFMGLSLVLLHATAVVLHESSIASDVNVAPTSRWYWWTFWIAVIIAGVGVVVDWRQRIAHARRLTRMHDLLDSAEALLTSDERIDARTHPIDAESYAKRMTKVVEQVRRLVDERRQREREVMRADQLAMVGQMAAGVAHELRNPLTSIKMLVQTAQREGSPGLADGDLAIVENEIRRLEKSLQRFLDFARPPRPERRPLDLARVIGRALALIEGRARKQRVALSFVPPAEPMVVEADEDQMQQLLLNLMLNSLDVMPDGGALTVELAGAPANHAELRVRDTGPGIPAELLPRLFDPFVSTKETGIGLGLAVSHRIAERHGGTLSADNQVGRGACFVLRLPRARTESAVS